MLAASTEVNSRRRRPWRVHGAVIAIALLLGPVSGAALAGCSAISGGVSPAASSEDADPTVDDDDEPVPDDEVVPDDEEVIPSEDEVITDDAVGSVLPEELLGMWVSIDQGDAETIYRFVADGTYDQVSILMQARASGTFSFMIQATGFVQLDGERMVLTPTSGNESMEDPDSPSSNFDRPLSPLTAEEFVWTIQDGTLFLTGQYGTVGYEWTPEG